MIDKADIEYLSKIFVTREDCDKSVSGIEKKLINDNMRLEIIEHNTKIAVWLIKTTLGALIALIVGAIWKIFLGG